MRLILYLVIILSTIPAQAGQFLFDASHEEMSGNADWVIDSDFWNLNLEHYPCSQFANESNPQNIPSPAQSGITQITAETYWTGGISAWGVDLVKAGHSVSTLPNGSAITYGDGSNPYDLSNYDVFIIPEPQQPFTTTEKTAILSFVSNGGALFMVADHQTSDRNCSGWDSPHIFNDLMGVVISGGAITDYGLFGLVFNVQEISGLSNVDYWFDDGVDNNVINDPLDPIIHGPFGDGSGGIGFFGATSMTIDSGSNPSVKGHVWKTDAGGQGSTRVTFVTASYGAGRVAAIGDSSPADDGTGDPGDTLYLGWDKASGGVANDIIHLNACDWLLNGNDTTPPVITAGPSASPADCSAIITWSTDENATSVVDYGLTSSYGSSSSTSGYTTSHSVVLTGLAPSTLYHYRVSSTDGLGNGPSQSTDNTFTTQGAAAPVITSGPQSSNITASSATITWQTDEVSDSRVDYGQTSSYGLFSSDSQLVTDHSMVLTGLAPQTTYHYKVSSTDSCSNGPTESTDYTFTTSVPSIDISGWTIKQYNSAHSFTFPSGTVIPGGGYLVLARDAAQASFEAEWGALPPNTVFVNSGNQCPMINGAETFELLDNTSTTVDGITISLSASKSMQRLNPGDPPGDSASWSIVNYSSGTPGSGAGTDSGSGVVINEASDASSYLNEFVELYNDTGTPTPDTTPPAAITDLDSTPTGGNTVSLTWTAPGDDGNSGTATAYEIRYALTPILSEADFQAATVLSSPPTPSAAGSNESYTATGLSVDTSYFFAIKSKDEVPNVSGLSNSPGATTAGLGGTVDLSGWRLHQNNSSLDWSIPNGTSIANGDFLLIGRNVDQAAFETFWGISCTTGCTYLNSNAAGTCGGTQGCMPTINGSENYTLYNASNNIVDGQTVNLSSTHTTQERIDFCGNPGSGLSWSSSSESNATPGSTGASDCAAGIVISEFSDASSFAYEFIEIYNDNAAGSPGNVGNSLRANKELSGTLLQWARAFGAVNYYLRRGTTPSFMQGTPPPPFQTLTSPSYTDSDTPPVGTCYYYFVTAWDGSNESSN